MRSRAQLGQQMAFVFETLKMSDFTERLTDIDSVHYYLFYSASVTWSYVLHWKKQPFSTLAIGYVKSAYSQVATHCLISAAQETSVTHAVKTRLRLHYSSVSIRVRRTHTSLHTTQHIKD